MLSIILASLILVSFANAEETLTDADFKKMKIKQLKRFLLDRGVECHGCVEKSDFVRLAVQHAKTALKNPGGRIPSELPTDPLWDVWAKKADELCQRLLSTEQKENKFCNSLSNVVDSVVMKYAKRYQKELKVEKQQLMKYTLTEPYQEAGLKRIQKVIKWMGKTNTKSQKDIEGQLEEPLQSWLRDCSLQNINTMHDTLKDEL